MRKLIIRCSRPAFGETRYVSADLVVTGDRRRRFVTFRDQVEPLPSRWHLRLAGIKAGSDAGNRPCSKSWGWRTSPTSASIDSPMPIKIKNGVRTRSSQAIPRCL
ncbi:MAG: hypothetical protein MZU97_11050 [Bacillus subtilis]|nr:hypothetical protein [Bacillus subtilis]